MDFWEEISDAALEEFVENGFEGSRTSRIAERAGIAEGTIYNHVSAKKELFETVIMKSVEDHLDQVDEIELTVDDDPKESLKNLVRSAYQNLMSEDTMEILRLVLAETHRFPELATFYREEIMSRSKNLMGEIIEEGIDQGVFTDSGVQESPEIVAGPLTILIVNLLLEPDRELSDAELEEYLETHLDVVLHGVASKEMGHE